MKCKHTPKKSADNEIFKKFLLYSEGLSDNIIISSMATNCAITEKGLEELQVGGIHSWREPTHSK